MDKLGQIGEKDSSDINDEEYRFKNVYPKN